MQKKVFGNINPVGQILNLATAQYNNNNSDFAVQGVMKDFPQSSHFHPEIIFTSVNQDIFKNWAFTYLLLSENANIDYITSVFKNFIANRQGKKTDEIKMEAYLQNLTDIHLHSDKLREIEANSNITNNYVLAIAAIILLLISLSNYASLNLGMAVFSLKYLYLNKLFGTSKLMSYKYFITEGLIITMLSLIITIIIIIPTNSLIQKYLSLNLFTGNLTQILLVTVVFSILGIIAGILPVLKQGFPKLGVESAYGNNLPLYRKGISKGLIVIQYAFSIILIIAVLVIARQTNYVLKSSMGNQADNIICIESVQGKFQLFKEELLKFSTIESVSAMFTEFGGESNDMFQFKMDGYQKEEQDKKINKI